MQSRCKNRTQLSSYAVGPSLPGGPAAGAGRRAAGPGLAPAGGVALGPAPWEAPWEAACCTPAPARPECPHPAAQNPALGELRG